MQRERKQYSAPGVSTQPGDFKALPGMSDGSATNALGQRVKRGPLQSDATQGKMRFGLPQHARRFMFPQLWPRGGGGFGQYLIAKSSSSAY